MREISAPGLPTCFTVWLPGRLNLPQIGLSEKNTPARDCAWKEHDDEMNTGP
jgi:hypothetical protein